MFTGTRASRRGWASRRGLAAVVGLALAVTLGGPAVPAGAVLAEGAVPAGAGVPAEDVVPAGAVVDQFEGPQLGPDWTVLNADPSRLSFTERPGFLRVNSLTGDTWQGTNSARNLILQDIPRGDFQVVTSLAATVTLNYQSAGLLIWGDTDNYLRVGLAHVDGVVVENALERNAVFSSTLTPRSGVTAEVLKVQRVGDVFTTSYWDGSAWVQAAQVTADLDVRQVGLFALSAQNGTAIAADFDYFAVLPPQGRPTVPDRPFTLDGGHRGPFVSTGAGGVLTASGKRSSTQLALRATVVPGATDGGMTLRDLASGKYLFTRSDGRLALAVRPPSSTRSFRLLDAGGGKVRLVTGSGRYVRVVGGRLRADAATAQAATKLLVRPYADAAGNLDVAADAAGTQISDRLYGVFYEDINHAADGGLYAELVQNRSFEFNSTDNRDYNAMTAWSVVQRGGGAGIAAVTGDQPLNDKNLNFLRLDVTEPGAGVGVRNAGFNTGIAVAEGRTYDFSVWARTTAPAGTGLRVAVESTDGATVYASGQLTVGSAQWSRYEVRLTATGTTSAGRLAVLVDAAGTTDLDMVSLFPTDTFKGRKGGLRKDLAEKVAALRPSFVRFPGGCVTNVGNYEPFPDRRRIYRWKETLGPVEQRPTNFNFWGYNQSYGIGYFEYFQFSEDIGAEALPVVSVGVNGCNEDRPLAEDQLGEWVQDTLDLIEFANGPATSTWGKVRAEMGHPKPFGLEYVGLGNEEIYPEFYRNYPHFARAIEAAYPDIKIITNTGQTSQGAIFDKGWEFAREQNADLVDEHYYNNPEWFLANDDRYDGYDRSGPQVFVGEYASRGNAFYNALAEASFMTGLERNGDVVELASYAPLLSNVDYVNWTPDLIWFDNDSSYASASYHVQKMFSVNRGDRVVPSTFTGGPGNTLPDIAGRVGVATWNTQAVYDDVKVTAADGTVLFGDDFSAGAGAWTPAGGTWSVADGAYAQSSGATPAQSMAGSADWSDYSLEVKARKTGGAEGFLVMFGVKDTGNYYWWNLGGWGNTTSAVEKAVNGAKSTIATSTNTIETGRDYQIKITVSGRQITTYLDGVKVNEFTDDLGAIAPLYQVVTRDDRTGDTVLKVVNARDTALRSSVRLSGVRVPRTALVTSLTAGSLADLNTLAEPDKVSPVTLAQSGFGGRFTYDFPAQSVTFIRLRTR